MSEKASADHRKKLYDEGFAQVPRSVILGLSCSGCVHLYGWLALRMGGTNGRPTFSFRYIAAGMPMNRETVGVHARHLAELGIIDLEVSAKSRALITAIYDYDLAGSSSQSTGRRIQPDAGRKFQPVDAETGEIIQPVLRSSEGRSSSGVAAKPGLAAVGRRSPRELGSTNGNKSKNTDSRDFECDFADCNAASQVECDRCQPWGA